MNNLKIKVNGMEISLENSKPLQNILCDSDLEYSKLSKESHSLEKNINSLLILSNVKTVESFGYKSTEGVGQNIKNAFETVKSNIVHFFSNIKKRFEAFMTRILSKVAQNLIKGNPQLQEILNSVAKISEVGSKLSNKVIQELDTPKTDEEMTECLKKSKIEQEIANCINSVVTKSTSAVFHANNTLIAVGNYLGKTSTGNSNLDSLKNALQLKINDLANNIGSFTIDKMEDIKNKTNNISQTTANIINESKNITQEIVNLKNEVA